jgi:hypothetical protein
MELPWRACPGTAAVTAGATGLEHAVVVMTVVMTLPATDDHGAGKEQRGSDEHDPGNDHHPGRHPVQARRLFALVMRRRRRRWWRVGRRGSGG